MKLVLFAGASLLAASTATAQTVYTDRATFLAATSGTSTTTFEENGPGAFTSKGNLFSGTGFRIASTSESYTVDPQFDSYYIWNSGDVFGGSESILTLTADASLGAFGFDFGTPTGSGGNGTLTVNGVSYAALGQPTFNFFGIINNASAIGPITVNYNGGVSILDNVVTAPRVTAAVPEPATWGMMLVGFGMIGFGMRRRKSQVTTNVSFA